MMFGGLRRCEVLGLRPEELRVAERRVFIADGKGGRQRLIPVSARFFTAVADYLDTERPARMRNRDGQIRLLGGCRERARHPRRDRLVVAVTVRPLIIAEMACGCVSRVVRCLVRALIDEDRDAVTNRLRVGEPQALLVAGLAEEALACSEHDWENHQP
jgi:hypothetical protein